MPAKLAELVQQEKSTETSEAARCTSTTASVIGVLMAACLIGLSHDVSYLGTDEDTSIERGAGLDVHEKYERDLSALPKQRQVAFLFMIGIGGYCALTCRRDISFCFGPTAILMAASLTLVVASLLWSTDRFETSKEIVRILAYAFIAASLAMRLQPREICIVLATMGLVSVICAIGAELLAGHFQPWRSGYRLTGTLHTNVLASHAMITVLICFAFWQSSRRPRLLLAVMLAMLAVIMLTKTRGALATSCVGITAIYLAGKPIRTGLLAASLLLTTASLVTLLYVSAGSEVQSQVQRALLMGRAEGASTLTGRVPLWQQLWRQSYDFRWTGYGYGAFWTVDRMEQLEGKLQWYPGHAHSVYAQTMLDVGLIGLALFLALALACVVRAGRLIRSTNDPAFYFVFGFLVAGFVDGLLEVSFVYPRGLGLQVAMAMFSLVIVHAASSVPAAQTSDTDRPRQLADFGRSYGSGLSTQ